MSRCIAWAWAGLVLGVGWLAGAEAGKDGPPPQIGIFALKGMAGPGALQDVWGDLLRSEAVRKELGICPEQLDALRKISHKATEAVRRNFEEMQELRDAAPEVRSRKFAEIAARARSEAEETRGQIERVLRPNQLARLKQLALQLRGVAALEDKEIQEELKLTEEQKRQLKMLRESAVQQMREWWRPGVPMKPEARREKFRALLKEGEAKAMAILTAAQKAQFEEMKGAKFDLSDVRARGGGPPKP